MAITLTKGTVAFNGLLSCLADLVEQDWRPAMQPSETKYRDHLLKFLRAKVPSDTRVEREYRHGGTTADLCVLWRGIVYDDEVFIEIKRQLQQKTACDRLVGQIESLNPRNRKVLLVLVGDCDPGLVGRLREKYAEHTQSTGNLRIVQIRVRQSRAKQN
jgi:hypothetical protein